MCRLASKITVLAGLLLSLCTTSSHQALAQAPAQTDAERRAAREAQGYQPVTLWDRPDVRALRVEMKPMANRAMHQHDDVKYHLFIPLTGKIQLSVGTDSPIDAPIGQAFYIKRGTPHGFKNLSDQPGMAIEIFVKDGPTANNADALGEIVAALQATPATGSKPSEPRP